MANITINQTPTRVQYTASAAQTVFSYTFPIKAASDLKVYKRAAGSSPDDSADLLTLTVNYTVTGANTAQGGTVVLTAGATAGDIVTIVGDKPVDRTAIYDQSVTLSKADLNNDFNDNIMYDKQIETIQEQLTPKYARSELLAPSVREDNLILPILNDGYIWIGRGNFGDTPDDINTVNLASFIASSGAPDADFVIGTANANLPNAQVLGGAGTGMVYSTDDGTTGTVSIKTVTAFALTLLDDPDAATARTTLGLGTMAVQDANNVNITGGTIGGSVTGFTQVSGTNNTTLATTAFVTDAVNNAITTFDFKDSVVAGTTANLTASYNNGTAGVGATLTNTGALAAFSVDGVTPSAGDRILVKNQTNQFENGIYTVTTEGDGATAWVLTRATDFDEADEVNAGAIVIVEQGTTLAQTMWIQTEDVATMGTDNIIWIQFGGASFAPIDATYITQTPSASLTNEQALSLLSTGILKSTTGTGVVSIATLGTDYYGPGGTDVPVDDGGTGVSSFTPYTVICAGTTATGALQNVSGVGTSGQVLTSNGAGALPTWQNASGGGFTYVELATATASTSATLEFVGDLDGTYDVYYIELFDVITDSTTLVTNVLRMQYGTGGTPTWVTTSYNGVATQYSTSGSTYSAVLDSTGFVASAGTKDALSQYSRAWIYGSQDTSRGIDVLMQGGTRSNVSGISLIWTGYSTIDTAATAATSLKFYFNSGNILSGKIVLYGVIQTT